MNNRAIKSPLTITAAGAQLAATVRDLDERYLSDHLIGFDAAGDVDYSYDGSDLAIELCRVADATPCQPEEWTDEVEAGVAECFAREWVRDTLIRREDWEDTIEFASEAQ